VFANFEHTLAHLFVIVSMLGLAVTGIYIVWSSEKQRKEKQKRRR
jgi:hypothetical protein